MLQLVTCSANYTIPVFSAYYFAMGNLHVLTLLSFCGYYTITEFKFEDNVLSAFILSVFVCFLRFQQYDISLYISQLVYTVETVCPLCGTN